MALGYDGKLFILAFDHRGSFQKKMFGIEGDPSEEQTQTISDAKHLIFEGMLAAAEKGLDDRVDLVRQGERLPVEDHQLLLDTERVARPGELGPHGRRRVRPRSLSRGNRG